MTDREKLLAALLRESERRSYQTVGSQVSVVDVIAMLDALGAEHRRVRRGRVAHTAA